MEFIADLHIHSYYSRATSRECSPEHLDFQARQKGIDLLGTGDFTHRAWRTELTEKLVPDGSGFYLLKDRLRIPAGIAGAPVRFVVSGEISSIYKKNGRTRKVHNLILLPGLDAAEKLSARLETVGNLHSDGRPILGLDSRQLLDMTLTACPEALFIPAHIWTPHFSVLGAASGFDCIDECYEDLAGHIYAVETGLSSDPPMNWRVSDLDRFALVSNSDAHSPANLAREANIFDTACTYESLFAALRNNDRSAFTGTIEFFPEEGKYHLDGHRSCAIRWEPADTVAAGGICPVCGRKVTVGVLHRTEALADRPAGFIPAGKREFISIVPLSSVIAASLGCGSASGRVEACRAAMLEKLGPELSILRSVSISDIASVSGAVIAEGVRRVRAGEIRLSPGYDGEYGTIEMFSETERDVFAGQTTLFGGEILSTPSARSVRKATVERLDTQGRAPSGDAPEARSGAPDEHQLCAVTAGEGTVMVVAGPGTGKTRTLVDRICHLVNELHVSPAAVTAVTFTNRAAAEMRERCGSFLPGPTLRALTIGTFHGVCLRLLRENSPDNPPVIVDEATAIAIARETLDEIHVSLTPAELLRRFSKAKTGNIPFEQSLDATEFDCFTLYQRKLASLGAYDFDDLLLETLERITSGSLRPESLTRFGHLLVDEFQDINGAQYELIRWWGALSGNIFIIGDPHQSIYGFRGATPRFFNQFLVDFPQTRHITLTRNYRSTEAVVEAAKCVISRSSAAETQPALFSAIRTDERKIRLAIARNELAEARFIAETINRLVGGVDMLDAHRYAEAADGNSERYGFSDIAVLYRTHRQAEHIGRSLVRGGIAFRIAGRDSSLYSPAVSAILALLRLSIDPADLFSLAAILRYFKVSIGFTENSDSGDRPPGDIRAELVSRLPENAASLLALCKEQGPRCPPRDLVNLLGGRMGCSGEDSVQRLKQVADLAADTGSLIEALTLGGDADIVRNGFGRPQGDAVLLSTLHASKGLEFPVVIIAGVNEGVLPLRDERGECADIDEERRLFYVGITRARERLICTAAMRRSRYGVTGESAWSKFVDDIDDRYLVRETFDPEPEVTQLSMRF